MFPKFRFPSLSSRFLFFRSLPCPLPLLLQFSYCSFFSFVSLSLSLSLIFSWFDIWLIASSFRSIKAIEFNQIIGQTIVVFFMRHLLWILYRFENGHWKGFLEFSFPSPPPPSLRPLYQYLFIWWLLFFFKAFRLKQVSKKKTFRSGQA